MFVFVMLWFVLLVDKQQQMIREMYALISKRSERVCNFLEEVRSVLRILIEWAN